MPWWVGELRHAEKYTLNPRVNFSKYIWKRRSFVLMEAEGRSYFWEPKPKK